MDRIQRRAAVDDAYTAYDVLPLDHEDDWGDLATFLDASSSLRGSAQTVIR